MIQKWNLCNLHFLPCIHFRSDQNGAWRSSWGGVNLETSQEKYTKKILHPKGYCKDKITAHPVCLNLWGHISDAAPDHSGLHGPPRGVQTARAHQRPCWRRGAAALHGVGSGRPFAVPFEWHSATNTLFISNISIVCFFGNKTRSWEAPRPIPTPPALKIGGEETQHQKSSKHTHTHMQTYTILTLIPWWGVVELSKRKFQGIPGLYASLISSVDALRETPRCL